MQYQAGCCLNTSSENNKRNIFHAKLLLLLRHFADYPDTNVEALHKKINDKKEIK